VAGIAAGSRSATVAAVSIRAIDHLYAETRAWDASVAFWKGLGFDLAEQWGSEGHRAGRLVLGEVRVVLAEIGPGDQPPAFSVFFGVPDLDSLEPGPAVDVITNTEPTHWGSRWMRVRDPDGRVYSLGEEPEGG